MCFRKEFSIPSSYADDGLVLHLGPVDDMDIAYINGKKIGEILITGFWNKDRTYEIPSNILNPDRNLLTVFVIDNMGGGGIYSSSDVSITGSKTREHVVLNGEWKFMPVAELINNKIHFYDKEKTYLNRPELFMAMNQNTPSLLFNAMINPIIPFTIMGVIWDQGESNVGRGFEYRTLFPVMIECWRKEWNQGDFPFYYVQIAPWEYEEEVPSSAAELREAQLLTMSIPNTGMVVTTDIGSLTTIHPGNKQDVGKRLALWALARDYGFDSLVYSGPLYDSCMIDGNKIIIHFSHIESGLLAKNGPLTHFEIAGSDQKYYPASAEIVNNTVVVTSENVSNPAAVRFGWSAIAQPNLFNGAGLPTSPFRTDKWKRLSE